MKQVADIFSVGERTVYRLLNENSTKGHNSPPKKKKQTGLKSKVDDFDKCAIRQIVHQFFSNNELPTLDKILHEVRRKANITKISRSSLHTVLKKNLGFKFAHRQRKSVLLERSDIITWRRRYLREIKKVREQNRKIYFTDETWLNEGHTRDKVWMDPAILTPRQAFNEGLSTGLRAPSGKGKRLIITHIGSSTGFVDGGLLCFVSGSSGDYHEDMNGDVYEKWFKETLSRLDPNSVIVLDNASYHSRKKNKAPSTATKKEDIKIWLRSNNISFEDDMVRAELLSIVKRHKTHYETYVIDDIAQAAGHKVLRLPPYHCELNPIELVWAQVKGFVASHNKSFKMAEIKTLLSTAISNVDAEKWHRCVQHVEQVFEPQMWEMDVFSEGAVESLIINLDEGSSSSSSSSSNFSYA